MRDNNDVRSNDYELGDITPDTVHPRPFSRGIRTIGAITIGGILGVGGYLLGEGVFSDAPIIGGLANGVTEVFYGDQDCEVPDASTTKLIDEDYAYHTEIPFTQGTNFTSWDQANRFAQEEGVTLLDGDSTVGELLQTENPVEMLALTQDYLSQFGIKYYYFTTGTDGKEYDVNIDAAEFRMQVMSIVDTVSLLPKEYVEFTGIKQIITRPMQVTADGRTPWGMHVDDTILIEPRSVLNTDDPIVSFNASRQMIMHEFSHAFDSNYCGDTGMFKDPEWDNLEAGASRREDYITDYAFEWNVGEDKAETSSRLDEIMNNGTVSPVLEAKAKLWASRLEAALPGVGQYMLAINDRL